jgi:hypothetical protein
MLEEKEHFPFNDLMKIHVLNLERLPGDEDSKLVDWLRFIGAERKIWFLLARHTTNPYFCQ